MATLTNLTNKMQSVGKGLQRTSAFPIDKWQLWDSYDTENDKLIFTDPASGNITECETPDELAQLVAKSSVAYPGFTFSVVDINKNAYVYVVKDDKAVYIETIENTIENIDRICTSIYTNSNIIAHVKSNYYNSGYGNDYFRGLLFKPILFTNTNTTNSFKLNSISIVERAAPVRGNSVYLAIFKVNGINTIQLNGSRVEGIGNASVYSLIGISDQSNTFTNAPHGEEHIYTFNNSNIVLHNDNIYLLTFSDSNTINAYVSTNMVEVGLKSTHITDRTVAVGLFSQDGYSKFDYDNGVVPYIPEIKFKPEGTIISDNIDTALNNSDTILNTTFSKLNSPNVFTEVNTFNNGIKTTIVDIISADNSNISSVYKLEYHNNNAFGQVLNIAATSAANIIIDTYPGHSENALSVIQYGSTQYKGVNSVATYDHDILSTLNDNTLATTKFTKSNINSVSLALNTTISNTSSEVTGIVNTVSSFISGEVSNLSSKVINDVSSVSSAIDSKKIIMRIWN